MTISLFVVCLSSYGVSLMGYLVLMSFNKNSVFVVGVESNS